MVSWPGKCWFNASVERIFSALRQMMYWLISTVSQDCLVNIDHHQFSVRTDCQVAVHTDDTVRDCQFLSNVMYSTSRKLWAPVASEKLLSKEPASEAFRNSCPAGIMQCFSSSKHSSSCQWIFKKNTHSNTGCSFEHKKWINFNWTWTLKSTSGCTRTCHLEAKNATDPNCPPNWE